MKREERERSIRRIREASRVWQQADQDIEAMTGQRKRIRSFVDLVLHGGPHGIESVDDVPAVLRTAWQKSREGVPDTFAVRLLPEFKQAVARKTAAQAAIYTPEFQESLQALRLRRPSGVDEALIFLEANPYCFHSGYDKQRVMRYLRHVPLTLDQQRQLRTALLVAVREGVGVEFREYCRTARIVDTARFRRTLQQLGNDESQDERVRQRACWMLDAIIRTNGE